MIKRYCWNILISIDQLANALFAGSPDECISTRLYNEYPNSILRKCVDILFGKDHCKRSADGGDRQPASYKRGN